VGSLIHTECPCGLNQTLALGGGIVSHQHLCQFPVKCLECGAESVANLEDEPVACSRCGRATPVPFDDPAVASPRTPESGIVFAWHVHRLERDVELTDGPYPCPLCGERTMHFAERGMWD
jgi:hypothetical protein